MSPTTEQPERLAPETRNGVVFPEKLSRLRRNLGHKAKQEPIFYRYSIKVLDELASKLGAGAAVPSKPEEDDIRDV
jgi:ribosomal protein L15E